jgi:hypothetical protein
MKLQSQLSVAKHFIYCGQFLVLIGYITRYSCVEYLFKLEILIPAQISQVHIYHIAYNGYNSLSVVKYENASV